MPTGEKSRRIGFILLIALGAGLVVIGVLAQNPEIIFRFAAQI